MQMRCVNTNWGENGRMKGRTNGVATIYVCKLIVYRQRSGFIVQPRVLDAMSQAPTYQMALEGQLLRSSLPLWW